MIKKDSKYNCVHCGALAFIAIVDIEAGASFKSYILKTPIKDCKPLDKLVCYKCKKPLNIKAYDRWYE